MTREPTFMSVLCCAGVHEYTSDDGQETFMLQIEFPLDRALTITVNTKGYYGDTWSLNVTRWEGNGESSVAECKCSEQEAAYFKHIATELTAGDRGR
jgi:hypothetical protein